MSLIPPSVISVISDPLLLRIGIREINKKCWRPVNIEVYTSLLKEAFYMFKFTPVKDDLFNMDDGFNLVFAVTVIYSYLRDHQLIFG